MSPTHQPDRMADDGRSVSKCRNTQALEATTPAIRRTPTFATHSWKHPKMLIQQFKKVIIHQKMSKVKKNGDFVEEDFKASSESLNLNFEVYNKVQLLRAKHAGPGGMLGLPTKPGRAALSSHNSSCIHGHTAAIKCN